MFLCPSCSEVVSRLFRRTGVPYQGSEDGRIPKPGLIQTDSWGNQVTDALGGCSISKEGESGFLLFCVCVCVPKSVCVPETEVTELS